MIGMIGVSGFRKASLLALAMLAGCASSPESPFEEHARGVQEIYLSVENHDFPDAVLYSITQSGRRRLGMVTGKGEGEFTLSWTLMTDLSIEIHQVAGSTFTTRRITVSPGDQVLLLIERPLSRSTIQR